MPADHAVSVKTHQFVDLDRIAQEPHARLIIADAANDGAELADSQPCRQQIPKRQRKAEPQKNQSETTDCGALTLGRFCKPDKPLLPRKPLSFWNR